MKKKLEDINGDEFLRVAIIGSKEYGIVGLVPRVQRVERLVLTGLLVTAITVGTVLVHLTEGGEIPPWLASLLRVIGVVIGA